MTGLHHEPRPEMPAPGPDGDARPCHQLRMRRSVPCPSHARPKGRRGPCKGHSRTALHPRWRATAHVATVNETVW